MLNEPKKSKKIKVRASPQFWYFQFYKLKGITKRQFRKLKYENGEVEIEPENFDPVLYTEVKDGRK